MKAFDCLSECIFKAGGVTNDAGELNKEKYIEASKVYTKNHPALLEMVPKSFDTCKEKCEYFIFSWLFCSAMNYTIYSSRH